MEWKGVPHFVWISKSLNLRDWTKEMDKGLGGFLENLQTHFLYYKNSQTREVFAINPTLLKPHHKQRLGVCLAERCSF